MNPTPSAILIVGESGVGKTHYGAQLLLRLNQRSGALQMRSPPTNVTAFEETLQRLSLGLSADHTASAVYLESCWPVVDSKGQNMDLFWPDYAGEQVRNMHSTRRVPPEWRDRLIQSAGWLLFIRPHHLTLEDDIFSRPLANLCEATSADHAFQLSDQARLVELLQLLLYIRGTGTLVPLSSPALMVLLSCWDELSASAGNARPADVLAARLPLLADFITSNWRPERCRILGLSALGRPLRKDSPDNDYVDQGPERFGYFVRDDGSQNSDLTLPVVDLATLAR